jgi:hypothetical protein
MQPLLVARELWSEPADNEVVEAPIEEFLACDTSRSVWHFLGCRFGIPAIIASGSGSVINMASNVALMASPSSTATPPRRRQCSWRNYVRRQEHNSLPPRLIIRALH